MGARQKCPEDSQIKTSRGKLPRWSNAMISVIQFAADNLWRIRPCKIQRQFGVHRPAQIQEESDFLNGRYGAHNASAYFSIRRGWAPALLSGGAGAAFPNSDSPSRLRGCRPILRGARGPQSSRPILGLRPLAYISERRISGA
jgi:hypothetical protein